MTSTDHSDVSDESEAEWAYSLSERSCGDCLENLGTSTSHNSMGLHGLLHGYYYSVALVRKLTIRTERPPLVGEVNASFSG
jgi:hypothetical protein